MAETDKKIDERIWVSLFDAFAEFCNKTWVEKKLEGDWTSTAIRTGRTGDKTAGKLSEVFAELKSHGIKGSIAGRGNLDGYAGELIHFTCSDWFHLNIKHAPDDRSWIVDSKILSGSGGRFSEGTVFYDCRFARAPKQLVEASERVDTLNLSEQKIVKSFAKPIIKALIKQTSNEQVVFENDSDFIRCVRRCWCLAVRAKALSLGHNLPSPDASETALEEFAKSAEVLEVKIKQQVAFETIETLIAELQFRPELLRGIAGKIVKGPFFTNGPAAGSVRAEKPRFPRKKS